MTDIIAELRHVIPINDRKQHTCSVDCPCKPLVQDKVATHHAWDCREPYERMSGQGRDGKPWAVCDSTEV
jgi:hypothetical protein